MSAKANINLETTQETLEDKLASLHKRLQTEQKKLSEASSANPSPSEMASDYALNERRFLIIERIKEQVEVVQAALDRLKDGTYGLCERCGEPITAGRLEIIPEAEYCMDCQNYRERPII